MATLPPSEKPLGTDEELALAPGRAQTNGGGQTLPTHVQRSDSDDVEPKPGNPLATTPRAAWDRFNGRGRKRVGFFQSVKSVVLSSCSSLPIVFGSSWNLPQILVLNVFLIFLPFAWASHFRHWGDNTPFVCA